MAGRDEGDSDVKFVRRYWLTEDHDPTAPRIVFELHTNGPISARAINEIGTALTWLEAVQARLRGENEK